MASKNFEVLDPTDQKALAERLNRAIGEKMIILAGQCQAVFDGRIKSVLEKGDRLVIIKSDLAIVMHSPRGVKPINWQKPRAGPISIKLSPKGIEIFTQRTKTKEIFTITFTSIVFAALWLPFDEVTMEIYGDESDMVNYLVSHPELIEDGFKILQTEYQTAVGPVDIRGVDKNGNEVIIEVKKRKATPADAHQLKRYIEFFEERLKKKVRGILIAPSFPENVERYLEKHKLDHISISWNEIFPIIKRVKNLSLDNFFENTKEHR